MNSYLDGSTKVKQKAIHRLGNMALRPSMIRKAAVIDINKDISLPGASNRRKNKNDFYRFLLSTNKQNDDNKVNNDVFIPRSILKKSYVPGSIKEQRLEAASHNKHNANIFIF